MPSLFPSKFVCKDHKPRTTNVPLPKIRALQIRAKSGRKKKYRSGGPLSTRSLFEAKNSGSNGLPKQERRGRTHCTCLGSFTSGPAARSPIYPLLKQHGNENPVWPIRNKSLSSEQFVFHCHGNLLEGNTWGACAWMLMAYHPLLQSSPSNNCPNKILIEIRMWLTILGTSRTDRYNNVFPDN